jgi:hypothetical protein
MTGDTPLFSLDGLEDAVEFSLESCRLGQRPIRILLVAEYHVL